MAFFRQVTQFLPLIRKPNQHVTIPKDFLPLLEEVMNRNLSQFYLYHGATCYAVKRRDVVWLDFMEPIEIGLDFVSVPCGVSSINSLV